MILISLAWLHQPLFTDLLQMSGGVFVSFLVPRSTPSEGQDHSSGPTVSSSDVMGNWTLTLSALEQSSKQFTRSGYSLK